MKQKILLLDNKEKFIIFSLRYFKQYLTQYDCNIKGEGPYVTIEFYSQKIKQRIVFNYDFLRSHKLVQQIHISIQREGFLNSKDHTVELANFKEGVEEFENIEEILGVLKHYFQREIPLIIKGKQWFD
ncbi:hypothetical protein N9933_03685 [bacterium]|nr:hypothetical protein [bacterium]